MLARLIGVGDPVKCRSKVERLIATLAHSMKRISIQTNTLISRVVMEQQDDKRVATGVELANGKVITSNVGLSCSAGPLHTPPVLLLSGRGPMGDLARHDIPQKVDSPEIGRDLFNLMNVKRFWNLRNPEIGAGVGLTKWDDFVYKGANLKGFIVFPPTSRTGLEPTLAADEDGVRDDHPFLNGSRCHV